MVRKWITAVCLLFVCILSAFTFRPITASADMGPKPSVTVKFENMPSGLCYGTLLSDDSSTGPFSAWRGGEYYDHDDVGEEIFFKFVRYQDIDGYYFLQRVWTLNEKPTIDWTYYPPNNFKILLYFPESDVFVCSGIYDKYAFDSYYTVDMSGVDLTQAENGVLWKNNGGMRVYMDYNYTHEIFGLIARVVITLAVELLFALAFKFKGKKAFLFIVGVNLLTQVALNVALHFIYLSAGRLAFILAYVGLEFLIFNVEYIFYAIFLPKLLPQKRKAGVYVLYSLAANAVSFVVGMGLSLIWPGIF